MIASWGGWLIQHIISWSSINLLSHLSSILCANTSTTIQAILNFNPNVYLPTCHSNSYRSKNTRPACSQSSQEKNNKQTLEPQKPRKKRGLTPPSFAHRGWLCQSPDQWSGKSPSGLEWHKTSVQAPPGGRLVEFWVVLNKWLRLGAPMRKDKIFWKKELFVLLQLLLRLQITTRVFITSSSYQPQLFFAPVLLCTFEKYLYLFCT